MSEESHNALLTVATESPQAAEISFYVIITSDPLSVNGTVYFIKSVKSFSLTIVSNLHPFIYSSSIDLNDEIFLIILIKETFFKRQINVKQQKSPSQEGTTADLQSWSYPIQYNPIQIQSVCTCNILPGTSLISLYLTYPGRYKSYQPVPAISCVEYILSVSAAESTQRQLPRRRPGKGV